MKLTRASRLLLVPLTVIAMASLTGAGSGDTPDPPAGTVSTTTTDPTAKAWRDKVTADAKNSGSTPRFIQAGYTLNPKQALGPNGETPKALPADMSTTSTDSTDAAASYNATGCTLQMAVYKSTYYNSAVASSLTVCTTKIGTVKHYQEMLRLDWFGWRKMYSNARLAYNTYSMAFDSYSHCYTGFGRSWYGRVRGDIWKSGNWWLAFASDESWLNCAN